VTTLLEFLRYLNLFRRQIKRKLLRCPAAGAKGIYDKQREFGDEFLLAEATISEPAQFKRICGQTKTPRSFQNGASIFEAD
jgi:hypothetical protein